MPPLEVQAEKRAVKPPLTTVVGITLIVPSTTACDAVNWALPLRTVIACIMPKTVNSRAGVANRYQQFYAVERAPSGAFKPISNFMIHVLHHIRYDSSIAGILGAIEQCYTAFC